MKIINKISILSLSVLVGLTGCKKSFLDQNPTSQVTTDDVFKTIEGAESALQGINGMMFESPATDEFGYPSIALTYDLMGNDMPVSGQGAGWFISTYRFEDARAGSGPCGYTWTFFYRMIQNSNMILSHIDAIQADQNRKDYVKAGAEFYRAFAYFNLAQIYMFTYAGNNTDHAPSTPAPPPIVFSDGSSFTGQFKNAPCVPIYTTPTIVPNGTRNTVEEVYTQIKTDLDSALNQLNRSNIGRQDQSEINLNVVQGLYARVALVKQDWPVAELMALAARSGFNFENSDQLLKGFNSASNGGWIWGSIINQEQNGIYASFLSQMDYGLGGYSALGQQKLIGNSLYNSHIDTIDVRRNWWVSRAQRVKDPFYKFYSTQCQIKFRGQTSTSFAGDFPLMRAEEMALIEAEAKAQQNKVADARVLLNEFVQTRDTSYHVTTSDSKALIDSIWIQRRVELWGEGFRLFDIKRQCAPMQNANYLQSEALGRAASSNYNSGLAKVMSLGPLDPSWNFRLPGSEILNNTKIIQNP